MKNHNKNINLKQWKTPIVVLLHQQSKSYNRSKLYWQQGNKVSGFTVEYPAKWIGKIP